jgi:hypothetical protein
VIKRILRTRLNSGFVFYRKGVKKEVRDITGFKGFKVDKRKSDGWIEIRDAQSWELWALVRRFEALGYGALYLGFGLNRRPFAFFRPYKRIRNLETIRQGVRKINKHFPFLRLSWTLRGGSLTGSLFHFRTEIIDLFGFVRFLSPLPSDVALIVARIFPKVEKRGKLERSKYRVLGGYIPSSLPLAGGIIKVNVRSRKTFMVVVGFSRFAGKVL